jgi:hypothetical protein
VRGLVLVSAGLVLALGCGGQSGAVDADATACARADPTCDGSPPSYASEVEPIVTSLCVPCHYVGSPYSPTDLVGYSKVQLTSGSSLGQVEACLMPPPGTPQLTEAQRSALMAWLACGAPDN